MRSLTSPSKVFCSAAGSIGLSVAAIPPTQPSMTIATPNIAALIGGSRPASLHLVFPSSERGLARYRIKTDVGWYPSDCGLSARNLRAADRHWQGLTIASAIAKLTKIPLRLKNIAQTKARSGSCCSSFAGALGVGSVTPTLTHSTPISSLRSARRSRSERPRRASGAWFLSPAEQFKARGSNGTILNAGADFQILGADGFTRLEARYVARLTDGSLLYVDDVGVRFGPPETMARIARGEPVDPTQVYFRSTPRFETAEPTHQWLTRPLFLATGARYPDKVALSVFEVG